MKAKIALLLTILMILSSVVVAVPTVTETVSAEAPIGAIRVGSFNIKNAAGGAQLDNIANQIRTYGLDVIGLQEVDYYTSRAYFDTMAALANRLGFYYAYFPAIDFQGGKYGVGTLSRWPISNTWYQYVTYANEPRILTKCVITTFTGYSFNFYNTHLDTNGDARKAALAEIDAIVQEPFIITGDFNTGPSTQDNYLKPSRAVSANTTSVNFLTTGGSCIDNIFASTENFSLAFAEAAVNSISDHYMIWANIYPTPTKFQGLMPVNVGDNTTIKIKSTADNKLITANSDGTKITAEADNGNDYQMWVVKKYANNVYSLINKAHWKALDVYNWGDECGSRLQLWDITTASAQRFYFYKTTNGYIIRPVYATLRAFDVSNETGEVQLWDYGGGKNQLFAVSEEGLDFGSSFTATIKNISTGFNATASGTDVICKNDTSNNSKWLFTRTSKGVYTIKNVGTGKYMYVSSTTASGTNVTLSTTATKFIILDSDYQFAIKPLGGTLFFDMDATNKDINLYQYVASEVQYKAQQFDIIWDSPADMLKADIGASGSVYIQNLRNNKYVSTDSSNMMCGVDSKTTLWKYTRNSDGSYTFANPSGLVLDVHSALCTTFNPLHVYESNGTDAQKFFLYSPGNGIYYMRPIFTGKVIDFSSAQKGQLYFMNFSAAQQFKFITSSGTTLNTTFTVKYNANGGTNAPGTQLKAKGTALKLSTTKPTRSGYTFLGWATSKTATTATYTAGGSYTADAAVTLYAVWKKNLATYTVAYDANGGTNAPASQTKTEGTALTLSTAKPTRDGYTFLGWAADKTATTATYTAGASYTADAAVTLYAVWEKDETELVIKESSSYEKSDKFLVNVKDKTSVADIISQFDNQKVAIYDAEGNEIADSVVGATGYTVNLVVNGVAVDSLVVVIKGDVDGNGEVTSTDYIRVKGGFLGLYEFEGAYFSAADVDGNGEITSTDYIKIKAHFSGLSNLFE